MAERERPEEKGEEEMKGTMAAMSRSTPLGRSEKEEGTRDGA